MGLTGLEWRIRWAVWRMRRRFIAEPDYDCYDSGYVENVLYHVALDHFTESTRGVGTIRWMTLYMLNIWRLRKYWDDPMGRFASAG